LAQLNFSVEDPTEVNDAEQQSDHYREQNGHLYSGCTTVATTCTCVALHRDLLGLEGD
jgi:hypothetical protein